MGNWRDELADVIKTQAERQAEEAERQRKRLEEALQVADEAMRLALEGLTFANEQLASKQQPVTFGEAEGAHRLTLHELTLSVGLTREDAVVKVTFNDQRPRDFDFSKDRHLSPRDVEEYVGRRTVELARAAQKKAPW